jgi:hypothetical protein
MIGQWVIQVQVVLKFFEGKEKKLKMLFARQAKLYNLEIENLQR